MSNYVFNMAMTRDEAQRMLHARLAEHPELEAVAFSDTFLPSLEEILSFHEISDEWLPIIANEVRVVLALYAPLEELGKNIAESTGLSTEKAESLAQMITLIILDPVYDDLMAYNYLWREQEEKERTLPQAESLLKEKLELRPEGVERVAQPLTREDLLNALSAKRTMASDVARLQSEPAPSAPVTVGYQNYSAPPQPPQR